VTSESALDELEALMRSAPVVPLTDQIRIDRKRAQKLIARLDPSAAAARLQELFTQARRVPLTSQIRLDSDAVFACIDEIRATR
jgi:hypothetical protein